MHEFPKVQSTVKPLYNSKSQENLPQTLPVPPKKSEVESANRVEVIQEGNIPDIHLKKVIICQAKNKHDQSSLKHSHHRKFSLDAQCLNQTHPTRQNNCKRRGSCSLIRSHNTIRPCAVNGDVEHITRTNFHANFHSENPSSNRIPRHSWITSLQIDQHPNHIKMTDDGFEEINFQDGIKHGHNYCHNIEVSFKNGIGDTNITPQFHRVDRKSIDYRDDVLYSSMVNHSFNEKGISDFIDITQNTPTKPPRHVKLKKPLPNHNNNFNQPSEQHDLRPANINAFNNHYVSSAIITNRNNHYNNDFLQKDSIIDLESTDCASVNVTQTHNYRNKYISIGVQASPLPPYRLRVLPKCPAVPLVVSKSSASTIRSPLPIISNNDKLSDDDDTKKTTRICCLLSGLRSCTHCLSRIFMSQCGLGFALFVWALLGAMAFHYSEAPMEDEQAQQLKLFQKDLITGLATDLRLINQTQPTWIDTIEKYFSKHEKLLLEAVSSGYGEGGNAGHIWSYPGCILFAVSLLTTLGFGAPVPRTPSGRTTAVIFSAIGVPFHLLLVLNIGMVLARCLQRWASEYQYRYNNDAQKCHSFDLNVTSPKWINWFPIIGIIGYYILGILLFGVARLRYSESLLFPLDFTATGGVATVPGYIRILYGLYLEGGVILAATAVSILQQSATNKLTDLGLKLGLLTNS